MESIDTRALKVFADKLTDQNNTMPEIEIKKAMERLGLVYTEDEIERLNQVLLALHPISQKIKEDTSQSNKEISH